MSEGDGGLGPGRIVILTPMNLEYKAVRAQLQVQGQEWDEQGTSFELGSIPGVPWQIVLAVTGEGGDTTAVLAERAIARYRPWALLVVGVAGGLKDDIALGDVIVATWVHGYHGGKEDDEGFHARPRGWSGTHRLVQAARMADVKGGWTGPLAADATPEVHFKPIAAGDVVLNSRESPLRQQLKRHYNDAAAIEMESQGAGVAAQLNASIDVLTVRGISDQADGAKHLSDADGLQPRAAAHAAAFTAAVLREAALAAGTPAGTPETGMRWRPLPAELPVRWLAALGPVRLGAAAVLELHLVPAGPGAPLEARRLAALGTELSALGRAEGMFESTQESMAAEAVLVTSRDGAGLAVTRAGQRSAWLPLPRDGLGAVLDPADVRDRLTTLLSALVGIDLPDPAQASLAPGITTTVLLAEGQVTALPRQGSRQRTSMAAVRVPAADTLPYAAITAVPAGVAEELTARLILAFRAQLSRPTGQPG
jgi:nucleoside phosphorylase